MSYLMASCWDDEIYQGPFFYFPPPHSAIFSWCHGEITNKKSIFSWKIKSYYEHNQQAKIFWSHGLTMRPWDISWSHGQLFYFHPPHHEITMINYIPHNEKFILNMPLGINLLVSWSHCETMRNLIVTWPHGDTMIFFHVLSVRPWGLMISWSNFLLSTTLLWDFLMVSWWNFY